MLGPRSTSTVVTRLGMFSESKFKTLIDERFILFFVGKENFQHVAKNIKQFIPPGRRIWGSAPGATHEAWPPELEAMMAVKF